MKTAVMKLKDIRPAAYNPRVTLKPGDKDYEALKPQETLWPDTRG